MTKLRVSAHFMSVLHIDVLKEIEFPSIDVVNIDNFLKEVEAKYS